MGDHLAEDFTRIGVADFGPCRDGEVDVVPGLPGHVLALAMLPTLRDPARVVSVIEQRAEIGVDFYVYASTSSAITTIRSPLWDKFLPSK